MKTSLKLIALLVAAGYPCVAFAEFLGAPIPAHINAETALGVFSAAVVTLLMMADYSRRPIAHSASSYTRAPFRKRESHRLAA